MNKSFTAAAVQLNSTGDIDANLKQAAALIDEAAGRKADIIALPECFSFLGPEPEKVERASEIQARSEAFLREQAAATGALLLGGGFAVPEPSGKTFNRALLTGPEGDVAVYDKIHLFDVDLPDQVLRESDTVTPGQEIVIATPPATGAIGLSICYDLRFPELYRELAARGATTIFIPAAFTAFTGAHHWHLLIRARAVENTCFVVAPGQCGTHFGKRCSYGHSLIVDPWGEVLAEAGEDPECILANIDPAKLEEVRRRLPSLRHRRLG